MFGPDSKYKRVLVMASFIALNGKPQNHAFTIINPAMPNNRSIKFFDSIFNQMRWFPRDPTGGQVSVDPKKELRRYHTFRIYALDREM